jgi:hypothetical protein
LLLLAMFSDINFFLFLAVLWVQQPRSDRHDPVETVAAVPRVVSLEDLLLDDGVLARSSLQATLVP